MDAEPTLTNLDQPAPHAASTFVIGQVLDGKYEILALLGRGGMGAVYRVRHILLNVELALKTLDKQRIGDASSWRRFQTEAKAAFSLKHPNLVKVHDSGVFEDGQPFLVMDLVEGKTLQNLIQERGRLPLDEIASIFAQLCFGLAHAHQQQVVHRDIKPSNIMLAEGKSLKEEGSVKILDFGIAKIVNADRGEMQTLTQTGEVFGSPLYMSPEQCSGQAIDQRTDVYSLGCVLFEALTGTPPLVGNNALRTMMLHVNDSAPSLKEATLGSQFPEELEKIIEKMLAKAAGDRYSDLSIVAHEIFTACAGDDEALQNTLSNSVSAPAASPRGPTKITLTYAQLTAALLSTAIVTGIFTFYIEQLVIGGNAKVDEPNNDKFDGIGGLPNQPTESFKVLQAQANAHFDRISSIAPVPAGPDRQKIVFPDTKIGIVYFADKKYEHRAAKGPIDTPRGAHLYFEFDTELCPFVLFNPTILEKIDTSLINGLVFTGPDSEMPENRFDKKQAVLGIDRAFVTFGKWNDIQQLKLRQVTLTPSIVSAADKMKNLKLIHFHDVESPPHLLEKREFWHRIDTLVIENCPTTEILKEAAKSPSIRDIESFSPVSTREIELLKPCSSLRKLVFHSGESLEVILVAATQFKQLKELHYRTIALSKSQMLEIAKHWKGVTFNDPDKNFVILKR